MHAWGTVVLRFYVAGVHASRRLQAPQRGLLGTHGGVGLFVCLFVVLWRYQAIIDEVRAGLKWLGVTVSSRTATARDKGKKRRKKGQVCIEVLRLFRFAGAILCYFFGAATHVRHPAMHQVEVEKAGGPGTPHTCMLGTPGNRP